MGYTSKHILKSNYFILWIALVTLLICTYTYYSLSVLKEDYFYEHYSFTEHDNAGYLIKTQGCKIPEMYLNGPDIEKYMKKRESLNCKSKWNYTLPLVTSNLTALTLNISAWATLNITKKNPLFKCYYIPIKRLKFKEDQMKKEFYDENDVKFGEKKYFEYSIVVPDKMVEVICKLRDNIIYRDYHIFIRPTPSTLNHKDGSVSIMILGLDSVSRLNFHRQMPKTNAFLSQLGNVEMLGYNKVEDNTFPNIIPLLSGLSVEEFRNNQCWPTDKDYFDNCHFVWNDFKNANFETAFVEDSPMIGMFNYVKLGFFKKPTDHYLRPIMLQAENKLGHEFIGNTKSCIGTQLGMTAMLDYSYKIALSMSNHLYMGVFWSSSLTHDYIEFPNFGDEDLRNFFNKFNQSGQLNKTAVILMSDHGMRWGQFRTTYQGGLEDRLPMLRFIIPEWFKNLYPKAIKNLEENTLRLTTPYDLHETLLDFIDTKQLSDESIERRISQNKRGTSLFLAVPDNRTCQTAGIPKHYCACHETRKVISVDDANVVSAANFLVWYINSKLSIYSQCVNLTLHWIHTAAVETGRESRSIKDYNLHITTVPGLAKFEATLRQISGRFKMVGSISRLNMYGNQSICVNNAKIKLLCYCNQQI